MGGEMGLGVSTTAFPPAFTSLLLNASAASVMYLNHLDTVLRRRDESFFTLFSALFSGDRPDAIRHYVIPTLSQPGRGYYPTDVTTQPTPCPSCYADTTPN
ncbi:hypothetical protein NP493_418g01012 [Ridgeia piscesae]|uniref:Uncharacterized protein n=1 Tax=Ridgeia piscesae TaxID=27915 RepID=A0AAD9L0W8_RIDPI|nr:hypothetical protein NP493_418g01012 [Ridgeia piscesae]